MKNLGVVLLSGILVTVLTGGRPSAIPDRQNVGQDPVGYGFALRPGEPLTLNTACRDTVEYVDSYGGNGNRLFLRVQNDAGATAFFLCTGKLMKAISRNPKLNPGDFLAIEWVADSAGIPVKGDWNAYAAKARRVARIRNGWVSRYLRKHKKQIRYTVQGGDVMGVFNMGALKRVVTDNLNTFIAYQTDARIIRCLIDRKGWLEVYAVAGWAEDDSLVVDADITGYLPAGRNGKVSVSIVYNYWASNPRKYYILDDETGEYSRWQSPDRFAADMILND